MNDNLDTLLEQKRPALLEEERGLMLRSIEEAVAVPVPSPYFSFLSSKIMTTLLIALMLTLGASGTVLASDNAKPGDLLFPIERVSEQTQLLIADEAREAELRAKFTAERLAELKIILSEEDDSSLDDTSTTTDDSLVIVDEEGEARIGSAVQVLLDYAQEVGVDDARNDFLRALLVELGTVKVSGRSESHTKNDSQDSRLKVSDDRIEIKEDGYRIRIDDDGEIRIKEDDDFDDVNQTGDNAFLDDSSDDDSEDEHDDSDDESEDDDYEDDYDDSDGHDDDESEDDDRHERRGNDDSRESSSNDDLDAEDVFVRAGVEKFEVTLSGDKAEVRIEYKEQHEEYETTYVSDEALVVEAAGRTGIPIDLLLAALEIDDNN